MIVQPLAPIVIVTQIANYGDHAAGIALTRACNLGENAIEARQVGERISNLVDQIRGRRCGSSCVGNFKIVIDDFLAVNRR